MDDIVVTAKRLHALSNSGAFYEAVRATTGALDTPQVRTIDALITEAGRWPIGWLAYALGTAWHECRLRPIHEMGGPKYLAKYDTGGLAKALGNTPEADGDGILYAGRGLVQLTGRRNYDAAGKALGIDLLNHPDKALEPAVATRILIWGMEGGHFTGKGLGDYLTGWNGDHASFVECRRIINGSDKAELIAGYADKFQHALQVGGWA